MLVSAPKCLTCKHFRGRPSSANDKAKCAVKARGIPNEIYFKGKPCAQYVPKGGIKNGTGKK